MAPAYRALSKRTHPDKLAVDPPSVKSRLEACFTAATEAYGILQNPDYKQGYDKVCRCVLPDGWTVKGSRADGSHYYYYNTTTGATQNTPPAR